MTDPRVTIYYRPQSSSCEEARQVLERVRPYEKFHLEEVDITQNPVAYGLHYENIPVVTINGQIAFRHRVDEDRLIRRIKIARQQIAHEEEERRKEQEKAARGGKRQS